MMDLFVPENSPLCDAVWAGFVMDLGREKKHWERSAKKECTAMVTGCRELEQHCDCCPGTGLCPARLLRQCRHAERQRMQLPGIPTSPEPYKPRDALYTKVPSGQ